MKPSLSSLYFWFALLVCTCLQLWSTYKGVGTTWDSVQYLATAENLGNGNGFLRENDQIYREWALGFPLILIFFRDSIFLNLGCLWITLYLFFYFVEYIFEDKLLKYWLFLTFAFATPLYLVHHFMWTEPPFLCCLFACIWFLHQKKLLWAIVFGFLLMSLKNSGIYFLAAISSGAIIFYGISYWKKAVVFGITSSIPFWVWFGFAKFSSVTTFRQTYHMAYRSFGEELLNYSNVLSTWLVFPQLNLHIRLLVLIVFLIAIAICLLLQEKNKLILLLLWVSGIYLLGMLLTRAGMAVDAERFLALIYLLVLLIVGFVIDKLQVNRFIKYGMLFLWLCYPFVRTIKNIVFWSN